MIGRVVLQRRNIEKGRNEWWKRIDTYTFCIYNTIYKFHPVPNNNLCMRGQIGVNGVSSVLTVPCGYLDSQIVESILEGQQRSITVADQLAEEATRALKDISNLEFQMEEV